MARSGDGLVARFPLDDGGGTSAADVVGGHTATAAGSVTWGTGYAGGCAVLNGGYLATSTPLVRTDQSFSVAAWVLLTGTAGFATALSQDGAQASGCYLQYSAQDDRWAFAQVGADVANATATRALSTFAPQVGAWTHLVGVYDAAAGLLRIHVNGAPSGSAAHSAAWQAGGGFQIGRGRWNGAVADLFPGSIDDVRVYSRALTDDDVRVMV